MSPEARAMSWFWRRSESQLCVVIFIVTPGCFSSHGLYFARARPPQYHCFLNTGSSAPLVHSAVVRSGTSVFHHTSMTAGAGGAVGAAVAVTTDCTVCSTICVSLTTEVSFTVTTWVCMTG